MDRACRSKIASLALAFAAAAASAGCFFFDDINSPPKATFTLEGNPGELYVNGADYWLNASQSADAEDGEVTYAWVMRSCPSPNPCDGPIVATPGNQARVPLFFPLVDPTDKSKGHSHQTLVVTLTVSDSRHAPSSTWQAFPPVNREPEVSVELDDGPGVTNLLNHDGSYAVDRAYHFKAHGVDPDEDPVALTWRVAAPSGHQDVLPIAGDGSFTVVPDAAMNWQLEVVGSDGIASRTAPIGFVAADDQPPCVQRTDPEVPLGATVIVPRESDDPFRPATVRFRIDTVRDDFDTYPYPAAHDELSGVTHFAWAVGLEGTEPQPIAGRTSNDYVLDPAVYAPGERVLVRGVALDRKDKRVPKGQGDDPDCYQRVDWLVEVR